MKNRCTIRQFKFEPVEDEKIVKILESMCYSDTEKQADSIITIFGFKQKETWEICLDLFKKGKKFRFSFTSYLKRIQTW